MPCLIEKGQLERRQREAITRFFNSFLSSTIRCSRCHAKYILNDEDKAKASATYDEYQDSFWINFKYACPSCNYSKSHTGWWYDNEGARKHRTTKRNQNILMYVGIFIVAALIVLFTFV